MLRLVMSIETPMALSTDARLCRSQCLSTTTSLRSTTIIMTDRCQCLPSHLTMVRSTLTPRYRLFEVKACSLLVNMARRLVARCRSSMSASVCQWKAKDAQVRLLPKTVSNHSLTRRRQPTIIRDNLQRRARGLRVFRQQTQHRRAVRRRNQHLIPLSSPHLNLPCGLIPLAICLHRLTRFCCILAAPLATQRLRTHCTAAMA